MRKFAGTIAALLVFAALLVWVLTKERGRVPEKEEIFRTEIAGADDIVKLEVVKYETKLPDITPPDPSKDKPGEKPDGKVEVRRIIAEKRDDEWWVTKPYNGLMDPDTAEKMVKAIVELKPSLRKGDDINVNAEEYGLTDPNYRVTATLESGNTIAITLGESTPVGSKVYAKIDGKEGLLLVPSMFTTDLDKDPMDIRDKKLARFEKDDVVKATFVSDKGKIVAEKHEDGDKTTWQITSPGAFKGDEFSITSSFGKAGELEASEFAKRPKKLKLYGLDKPQATCRIELEDGKVIEVLVGKQITREVKKEYSEETEEKDLVYAMRKGRPEVLLVEATLLDDLTKDVLALRDKHILDFRREQVMTLEVARKRGLSFTVARMGDLWNIKAPQFAKANKTKVDDIIWDLTDLEAKEYMPKDVDMREIGLAVPSCVITVRLRGGKSLKIKFGDEVETDEGSRYYCQTSESKQVYKVSDMAIKDLPEEFENLKEGGKGAAEPSFGDQFGGPSGPGIE